MPSTTESPPSAGSGASGLRPSSSCSTAAEGRVPGEASGEELSCGLEFVADETEAEEPGPHGVFGVLVLLGLGAGGLDRLGHLAQGQAKLDVAFELPGVKAILPSVCRGVKLEKPKLDRALRKGGVEVEHVVARVVVMLVPAAPGGLGVVPDVRKGCHRFGLALVELPEEVRVDRLAVVAVPVAVSRQPQGVDQELLMAGHDVGQVSQRLRRVAVGSDVDVDPAAPVGIAFGSGLTKLADQALQKLHVLVPEDRGNQFALLGFRPLNTDVPGKFPLAALGVPGAPGPVAVAVGGVLAATGAEVLGGSLGGVLAGDVVHFNLDPDGLVLHLADLAFGAFVHGRDLRFCVFLSVVY